MSKKCPFSGSYNTEISITKYATRAAVETGRYVAAVGASLVAGVFSSHAGHAASHAIMQATEPGELKGHHCCNCGKDFSV